ncbi:MAG: Nudix family hydrolase [Methylovulum sp.]|uniref:Nudix family hydrolase n=1 Tax=Methylovulum sp. TaxID=1916980 RepID=UPI002608F048|nr:Nudix family hydrolase [Methylovulum sp.]MDD2724111.1 Nudix family hydrolase [Methylovulum sp.]MDD5124737.1 Nudix family hydrolase [Methylovulum sp.]
MDKNHLQVAVGVIKNAAGQVLIALRDESLHQGGLWEFPGGKLEAGETAEQALVRELQEELAITVNSASPLITIKHQYPDLAVQLLVFEVADFSGVAQGNEGQPLQWVAVDALMDYAFPAANRPIIAAVRLPPFYAILEVDDEAQLLGNLQKILANGVKLIQIRLKNLPIHDVEKVVEKFLKQAYLLCRQHDACLLGNSALAHSGHPAFHGIHLTSRDLLALDKRPENRRWLAASCHNFEQLQHAERIGVDFAVLAPVLPTPTHPNAAALGWAQFADWVAEVNIPVYALGGMALPLLKTARGAGAQGIASIRAFLA